MNSDLSGTTTTRTRTTTRHKMPFLGRTLCRGPTKTMKWVQPVQTPPQSPSPRMIKRLKIRCDEYGGEL